MTDRVLVVIPTFNEAENVGAIVARMRAAVPGADVLIVDDGSPDGTGRIADRLSEVDDSVSVLHRAEKAGLGVAYIAGFSWALERGYDVVVEMDADGSHAPEQLPRLIAALADADLVLGSRWVPGGDVEHWSKSRIALSRLANTYARLMLRMPLRDATAGFRAYRADVLRQLPLEEVSSQGYCFQIDLALRTHRGGFRVAEVPITFTERTVGKSKMSGAIMLEALWRVAWWGIRDIAHIGVRRGTTEPRSTSSSRTGSAEES